MVTRPVKRTRLPSKPILSPAERGRDPEAEQIIAREFSDVSPIATRKINRGDNLLPEPPHLRAVRFEVIWSEDGSVQGAREGVSRREIQQLKTRRYDSASVLDLHGARVSELGALVRDFVRSQRLRGAREILVVHGKGIHSEGGIGVLREQVVKVLTQGPSAEFVRALVSAPEQFGGRGALVVQLVP
jgi:DNA-nicking Smr family endonuclease